MLKISQKYISQMILDQMVEPEFEVSSPVFNAKGYEIESGHVLHLEYTNQLIELKQMNDEYFFCAHHEDYETQFSNQLETLQNFLFDYFMMSVSFDEFFENIVTEENNSNNLEDFCVKAVDENGQSIDLSSNKIDLSIDISFYHNDKTGFFGILNDGQCYMTKKKEIFEEAISQVS